MGQPSLYCQDITELFDVNAFIKNKPLIERRFYHLFSDTQIFTSFIEQRSFAHAESTALAFFDECTEKVRILFPFVVCISGHNSVIFCKDLCLEHMFIN